MKLIKLLNPENVTEEELSHFRLRDAARAVVLDRDGLIALFHVTEKGYYKLPGGGVEDGEDKMTALARECKEEIGCEVEVVGELGIVVEYRKIFKLKQTSYCYLAKVKWDKGRPNFTDYENENGFKLLWLPYAEALKLVSGSKANNVEGRSYITSRDTAILMEADLIS